jgi:hypothetical protein
MPTAEEEAMWRAEFEAAGESETRDRIYRGAGIYPDPKRQAALDWLRERARERSLRETQTHRYAWWTLWAAIVAVVVGLVGVAVTWFH